MSNPSNIEWTEATWPVITGCTAISPGCANCYAIRDSWRLASHPNPKVSAAYAGAVTRLGNGRLGWTGVIQCLSNRLDWPFRWRRPRRVFVSNESDLFHECVPDEFIDQVFAVMALCQQHTFQVLTKRPERMRAYFGHHEDEPRNLRERIDDATGDFDACHANLDAPGRWPLPNVWLGVSVENQRFADERIPLLLETPAAKRFISAEPLLGDLDLTSHLYGDTLAECGPHGFLRGPGLNWVIVGGESGPQARPCHVAWIRSIHNQCHEAGVACFVKQFGTRPIVDCPDHGCPHELKLNDRKGADPTEWPTDLRVRGYPV